MRNYLVLMSLVFFVNTYSQNTFKSNFDGVWKLKLLLKDDDSSINFSEYIKFINNEIYFFKDKSMNKKPLFIKKVEFENNTESETRVRFENGEVWEFDFRNINNEVRLIWRQTVAKNGDHLEQIDDRWALKNKDEMKKALEGEINTYYIKVK